MVLFGIFLLMVELVLIPGISVALFGALASFGTAIYLGFARLGVLGGVSTCVAVAVIAIVTTVIVLREKTWDRFRLKSEIKGTSQEKAEETPVRIGQRGTAITRLAPMGRIVVDGHTYEAKSPTVYIDEMSEVEVVGFENFSILVKKVTNS